MDQWNQIESRNRPILMGHLIYNKSDAAEQWGKEGLLNKWYWVNSISIRKIKRKKVNPCLVSYTKINSK